MTILIVDKTDPSELRNIFTLFGTPFKGTRLFWLSVPTLMVVGVIVGLTVAPVGDTVSKVSAGVIYGVLIIVSLYAHTLGHILSSRVVGAPVTYILMSATVNTLYFDDSEPLPRRVHIGRALGGPLCNLIVGFVALLIYSSSNIRRGSYPS